MANSAMINGKHLFREWGLQIENNNIITPPEVNDAFVQVYGGMTIDITEANGEVSYKRRKIHLELGGIKRKNAWRTFFSQFLNVYHGKEVTIIFDDDKHYFYKGRAYIKDDVERVARIGKFVMDIDVEPYKYEVESSQDEWKWDSFLFPTGVIRYIGEITVSGGQMVRIQSGDMLTVPVFHVSQSQNLKLIFKNKEYVLNNGRNRYPQIKIGKEKTELQFTGTGKVKIDYRGGSL